MELVSTYKAQVKNGRIILDEPTELPDGTVIELERVDRIEHLEDADDLGEAGRKKLRATLMQGIEQAEAGLGRSGDEFLADFIDP